MISYSCFVFAYFFCFKQKTAYEMRISDWSSDWCSSDLSDRHACSIGLLIQLSGRSGAASAQARRMAGNAWSAVTRNLSERIVLRSDRDKCSPLHGRIARLFGSTQKISGSYMPSAMGTLPIAQARRRILISLPITQQIPAIT